MGRALFVCCILSASIYTSALLKYPALNAGLFGLFGSKQPTPAGWVLHTQTVKAEKLDLKAAGRPCLNWAWVAAITDMAATRGVRIDQQYLVDRLYGGSRCEDSVGNSDRLAKEISHDYVLDDGQRFALSAKFAPGAPSQMDPLILSLRQSRPLMLLWNDKPYLLTGMTYDEYIAASGNKMFIVTELQLFDPLGAEGNHQVTFSRDKNNPDELNGILDLSVYTK